MFGFGNDDKVRDPVCGMKIDGKTAQFYYKNGGNKFYFCSQNCKDIFVNDMQKSAKSQSKGCC